jgi:uncharacterized membrane protein
MTASQSNKNALSLFTIVFIVGALLMYAGSGKQLLTFLKYPCHSYATQQSIKGFGNAKNQQV